MYNLKPPHKLRHLNSGRASNRSALKTRQLGASIMELMVGITIGLLVVIAALGSLVYTHVSSTTMVDATRLQQKADSTFRLINFQTLQAGAIELTPTVDPATVVFSTTYTGFNPITTTLATNIVSVHGVDEDGLNKDVLRISYQDNGTNTLRDCLGQTTAAVTQNIRVDNEFTYVAASNELRCKGAAAGATAQPVLDGVEDFQVTYGIRTVALVTKIENFQLLTAAQVDALPPIFDDVEKNGGDSAPWARVSAINVCLQLRGDMQGNPQPGMNPIVSCAGPTIANDGRLRRVFRRTFSLRNALL
jgi:type IV pilus assembly protein PilW